MFIVIKEDNYGYEDGVRIGQVFGPFPDEKSADAFEKRCRKIHLIGVDYSTREITDPQERIDWINQLDRRED